MRFARLLALGLAFALWSSAAAAQVAPPCLLETPQQRAIWDRMKAENHVGYQQLVYNTTWDRYNDIGRWEMTTAIINRDPAMMQRSFAEVKRTLSDFTNIFKGNESREFAVELPVMYGCMYPYLNPTQRQEFKAYIVKVAEGILELMRPGDSDQATGNYLGLVLMDKVMGTTFLSRTFNDGLRQRPVGGLTPTDCRIETSMRDAVCNFAKIMSADGAWPEGTAYNGGTLWFYLTGVQLAGIQYFPETIPFIKSLARLLMHEHTPGLRNRFEFGDTEHPNELLLIHGPIDVWQVLQSLLDEVGETQIAAMLRQFEVDFFAANGITQPQPLYARYYYRHNPYAMKAPWRQWAGNAYAARGQGLSYWRTGWGLNDRATYFHAPGMTQGIVDHWQAFEIDFRMFRKGFMSVDHPLGYSPDRRFFNTVMVRDTGPSPEAGGLVGTAFVDGVVGYASGFNAGVSESVYEGYAMVVPTFQHGQFRSIFQPLDGGPDAPDVLLVVDTLHAQDPATLTASGWQGAVLQPEQLYSKAVIDRMRRAKPLTFFWHAPTRPTINGKSIGWAVGATKVAIQHIYPDVALSFDVVDEKAAFCTPTSADPGCLSGYVLAGQLKWSIRSSLPALPEFSVNVHCVTALESGTATCEPLRSTSGAPAIGGVIRRQGLPTVTYLQSAVQGPKLVTSVGADGRVRWDSSKGDAVVRATRLCAPFGFDARGGDVYLADLCEAQWEVLQNGVLLTTEKIGALLRARPAPGAVVVRPVGVVTPPPPTPPVPTPPTPPTPPSPTCTYTAAPAALQFTAGGGGIFLKVTASSANCAIPAVKPSVDWVSAFVTGGFPLVVAQQNSGAPRQTVLTIGNLTVPVSQDGLVVTCNYTTSPAALQFPATGGAVGMKITRSPSTCPAPTTSTASPWITVGRAGGTDIVVAQPNTGALRTGLVMVGSRAVPVTQAAAGGAAGAKQTQDTSLKIEELLSGVSEAAGK